MSPEVRAAVEARLGPVRSVVERGRGHGGTRVFRVDDVWVKVHTSARKHRQERAAYERVVPRLADAGFRVPTLLDRDDDHRLLILSHLDGEPAATASDRTDLHRQAGALLTALHEPPYDSDPVPLSEALGRRMDDATSRARSLSDAMLRRALEVVGRFACFEGVTRRWCHRDMAPENWLVHDGRLGLVDFEHTRPDAALVDLVKLADSDWLDDARTRQAFFRGHAPLDDADAERLEALLWLHAVATVAWADAHADAAFSERGRRLLRLLDQRAASRAPRMSAADA